jgi:hypothetical protein
MRHNKKFEKELILYINNEVDDLKRAEIDIHLKTCKQCKIALNELQKVHQLTSKKSIPEPDESILKTMRRLLFLKIEHRMDKKYIFHNIFMNNRPAYRIGYSVVLILIGLFLGSMGLVYNPVRSKVIDELMTSGKRIHLMNSTIEPYTIDVDKILINRDNNTVDIYYNTINRVRIRGDLDNPAIKRILRYSLLEEERPGVKYRALKAVHALARDEESLDFDIIMALKQVLGQEQSPGIKLNALKILQSLPPEQEIKNILMNILFQDSNPAVRMEAFEMLVKSIDSSDEAVKLFETVRRDSIDYINYRAKRILEKFDHNITYDRETLKF